MIVLIIDSSIQVIAALANLLVETGIPMDIHKAVTPNQGISLFTSSRPDVVVLDWNLPENKSVDLLREIKKAGLKTTVIALSIGTGNPIEQKFKLPEIDFVLDKYAEFEKIPEIITRIADNKDN